MRNEAKKIQEKLEAAGYIAKVWEKYKKCRVYVKRQLSKGVQDMGYIDVINKTVHISRNKARIRDIIGY